VWLSIAKSAGATELSFVNRDRIQVKKYPSAVANARFERIVLPLCELSETPVVEGDGERFSYWWKDLPANPWKFPYRRKYEHTTVTIRDSFRNFHRNSNRPAWLRFAKETGAVVIDDADKVFMSIGERWDLYQCRMNFFVENGPTVMCWLSDAPYTAMNLKMTPHQEKMGFFEGYQLPWANRNQKLVWKEDSFENIIGSV
jgi:hypothetical protein